MVLIKDIPNIQKMISTVQSISLNRTIGNFSYNFINDETVLKLKQATDSLSESQARLVLSYANLSKAEIDHIINQRNQIVSNELLTESQIEQAASIAGVNIAEDTNLSSTLALAQANGTLTASTLSSAMAAEGYSDEVIKTILAELGLEAQNYKTANSFGILTKSILANTVAMLKNPWTWVIGGLGGIIIAAKSASKAVEELRNNINELGKNFSDTKNDLDGYKTKIKEIQEKLNDSNISAEETVTLRKQLSGVQDELIKKYGTEQGAIESITKALSGEADELERIADLRWEETKQKIKSNTSIWDKIVNKSSFDDNQRYSDNLDRMVSELFNYSSKITLNTIKFSRKEIDQVTKYMANLGWSREFNRNGTTFSFKKIGDSTVLKNEISSIRSELNTIFGDELSNKLTDAFTKEYNVLDDIINKYSDYRDEWILREQIFNPKFILNNGVENGDYLRDVFDEISNDYKVFMESTDNEVRNSSLRSLASNLRSIFNSEEIPESVKQYFRDLYPTIFAEVDRIDNQVAYAQQAKRRAAILSGNDAYSQKGYAQGTGYVEQYSEEWNNLFDSFTKEHNIKTEEQWDILLGYIEKYKRNGMTAYETLEAAFNHYADTVETESLVLDYSNSKDKSNYTGANYVDDMQSDIKTLGDTLKQLQEGTFDDSALIDFFQDFPEFKDNIDNLEEAISEKLISSIDKLEQETGKELPQELRNSLNNLVYTAVNANRTLSESFETIKNSSGVYKELGEAIKEGTVNESILSSVAGLSDRLNTLVAGYYGGVVTIQEIYEEVEKQREIDFENYKQAYIMKQALDEDFYEHATKSHLEIIRYFKDTYKIDLQNFKNYQQAKQQVEKTVLGDNLKLVAKYYDAQKMAYNAQWEQLMAGARAGDEWANNEAYKVQKLVKSYEAAIEELNKIGWTDFESSLDGMTLDGFNKMLDSTKSDYNELFDFFERRIEVINQAIEKLDANLENLNSAGGKNTLISGKIGIVQEEIKNYSSALQMYQELANKSLSKLNADLQDKIKNGAVSITQLMGESGEEVNKLLEEYTKWADKVNDCNQQLIELKETLRDLALDKFNNIAQQFTDRFDLLGSSSSLIEQQISLLEEAGQVVGESFYSSQIENARRQRDTLEREKTALISELTSSLASGIIQKGTDEWLEMVKTIQELDESILDTDQSIEQLQNSILELADKAFDRLQKRFEEIKSDLNNINSLLQDEEVSSEEGIWSAEGLTRLGGYAQQFELARHNVEKYQEEIDRVNKAYADGLYSTTEYLDKISELTEAQWSEALAAEDAKKSIVELNKARVEAIKTGIQKQLDAYKKLIDERKKALSQEKEMYDWEKTLAEKDKNIAKLRNRLALLANDDSAAANAERVKLQQELTDALNDLEETQYEHSVQAQQDALDQSYEDFENEKNEEIKKLEEYLEDVEKVFSDSLDTIKKNSETIAGTLRETVDKYGVYISETITNAWAVGEGAIASYGETLSVATSGFLAELEGVEQYLIALQDEADATADRLVGMLSAKADKLVTEFDAAINSENELISATNMLHEALVKTLEGKYDTSGLISSVQNAVSTISNNTNGGGTTGTTTPPVTQKEEKKPTDWETKHNEKEQKLKTLRDSFGYKSYWSVDKEDYIKGNNSPWDKLDAGARNGDPYANNLMYKIRQAVKAYLESKNKILSDYAGYATGVHNLAKSQKAWTQELGREAILSPTRNAILTKLNKGDTVLTKEQTDNLFKWGKLTPEMFVKNNSVLNGIGKSTTPSLAIGNILTVNGNIDDGNVEKMKSIAITAVNTAFKKFSNEIIKR